MVFKRLYTLLRSNIPASSNSRKQDFSAFDYKPIEESRKTVVLNPLEKKEIAYLSNLELSGNPNFQEIKAAYKKLIKAYHPDKFHGDESKKKFAEQVTSKLNEAYAYFENKYQKQ